MRRSSLVVMLVLVAAALLVPAAALLVPATASAAGFVHLQTWGGAGAGDGHLNQPLGGIWADSTGSLWVCDRGNSRVQRFTADGGFMMAFGSPGTGNGQFNTPNGLCFDEARNVLYVADSWNNRVQYFTRNGDYLGQWGSTGTGNGQFINPQGIGMDAAGNVYVADSENHRVQVFDATGTYLRSIGSDAVGDGELGYCPGLAVMPDGTCYVTSYSRNRIAKFSPGGTFVQFIGSGGSGDGQLSSPYGLTFDKYGNLLVADLFNNRISRFQTDGIWLDSYGSSGSADGKFNTPSGVAMRPNGILFVAELGNNRVQKFAWDDRAPYVFNDYAGDWFSEGATIHFWATDDYARTITYDIFGMTLPFAAGEEIMTTAWLGTPPFVGTMSADVSVTDEVGNKRTRTVHYRVDTMPPVTMVTGAPAGWTNADVTLQFAAGDRGSGVVDTLCDAGGGYAPIGADNRVTVTTEGVTTVSYYSYDSAIPMRNQETPKTVDVRIDRMGPDAVPANNITVRRNRTATFKYTLNDNLSPTCTVKLVIKKKSKVVKTVSLGVKDSTLIVPPHAYTKKLRIGLAAGAYTWTVVARDLAGNIGSYAPKKLTVKL